jgi:hypothetical protein
VTVTTTSLRQVSDHPVDEHGRPLFARDALDVARKHAVALAEGREEPDVAAKAMWEAGFDGSFCEREPPDPEHCKALWLLWGALTDWIELKPEQREEAEASIRRAAAEWLQAADDEQSWRDYFDRWLYAEMGYSRPEEQPPAT